MGKSKELSKLGSADAATLQQLGDVMSFGTADSLTYGRAGSDTDFKLDIDSSVAGACEIEFHRDGVEQGAIEYITNDTIADSYLRIKAGSNYGLLLDASGCVTMPDQPAFSVAPGSTYSNTGGYNRITSLTAVKYNRGSHYNSSNQRFVAPVNGIYAFGFQFLLSGVGSSDDNIHIAFNKNGSRELFGNTRLDGAAANGSYGYDAYVAVMGHLNVELAANDYIELVMNNSNTINVYYSSSHTWGRYWGYLIG